MRIVFTCGHNIVSHLICSLTKEPVSHCAISIGDAILHSTFTGVELISREKFFAKRRVVFSIPLENFSSHTLLSILIREDKHSYDFLGLSYLFIRYIGKRAFGLNLPKANLWAISGMYTCTEFLSKTLFGKEDSLITPYGLYKKLGGKQ